MVDILPVAISVIAILAAAIMAEKFRLLKLSLVVFALSAGQIHLAVIAFFLSLMMENDWRIEFPFKPVAIQSVALFIIGILALTLLHPLTSRNFSELIQLILYLAIFICLATYLRTGEDIQRLLVALIIGCIGSATFVLVSLSQDWVMAPSIYMARGSNEGSIFLALLGVVPCAVMALRSRNPVYFLAAGLFIYLQSLATSRGSIAVSAITLLAVGYLWTQLLVVRFAMVAAGVAVLFRNVPQLLNLYEAQLNYSARERLALLEHGWALADERFWTGWGWGSTFDLAGSAPNTILSYPHFHNTYIQFILEVGVLGWIILCAMSALFIRWTWLAAFKIKQPAVTGLIVCTALCLAVSFMFDAMFFGADRSVQVIILLALCSRAVALATGSSQRWDQLLDAGGTLEPNDRSSLPELSR